MRQGMLVRGAGERERERQHDGSTPLTSSRGSEATEGPAPPVSDPFEKVPPLAAPGTGMRCAPGPQPLTPLYRSGAAPSGVSRIWLRNAGCRRQRYVAMAMAARVLAPTTVQNGKSSWVRSESTSMRP